MAATNIKLKGKAQWARLREEDRDVGGPNTPENIQAKLDKAGGMYLMNLYFDEGVTRKDLIKAGVPHKGMIGQLIKEDDEGNLFYKCKREHRRIAKNGKEYIFRGPTVTGPDGNEWDWDEDGLIGNGSEVEVTLKKMEYGDVTLVSMDSVQVLDHVKYEREEDVTPTEEPEQDELEDEIPF